MSRAEIERHLADMRPWEDAESIRAGIRPDRRPWYARGDVKVGVPAYEALYHYLDKTAAEAFYQLDLKGYGDEDIRDPDWPEKELEEFDCLNFHWKMSKETLERNLLMCLKSGELQARGFSSTAALDSPRQLIAPERWQDLTLDLKHSTATGFGLTVTQILISRRPVKPSRTRTSLRTPASSVRKWYGGWVTENEAKHHIPTRDEDKAAAKARFGESVSRDLLRELRRELAPASWKGRGRRRGTGNRKGREARDS